MTDAAARRRPDARASSWTVTPPKDAAPGTYHLEVDGKLGDARVHVGRSRSSCPGAELQTRLPLRPAVAGGRRTSGARSSATCPTASRPRATAARSRSAASSTPRASACTPRGEHPVLQRRALQLADARWSASTTRRRAPARSTSRSGPTGRRSPPAASVTLAGRGQADRREHRQLRVRPARRHRRRRRDRTPTTPTGPMPKVVCGGSTSVADRRRRERAGDARADARQRPRFGAFTPGCGPDLHARRTTANVTSTAGDAALSVRDRRHTSTNGAFTLPEALQVTPSKTTAWTGPVSSDRGRRSPSRSTSARTMRCAQGNVRDDGDLHAVDDYAIGSDIPTAFGGPAWTTSRTGSSKGTGFASAIRPRAAWPIACAAGSPGSTATSGTPASA